MSSEHRAVRDIYNPPPAPVPFAPPAPEPLRFTRVDVAWLLGSCLVLASFAAAAWLFDGTFGMLVVIGGLFVILESWLSGLAFLRRHPAERAVSRWIVFVAALVPWALGLGLATALMMGLFYLSD